MHKRATALVLTLAAVLAGAGLAMAADEKPAELSAEEAAMMAAMAPGEHHEHLAATAGTWDVVLKIWMDPAQPEPMETTGTATIAAIMEGRYVVQEYTGSWMGTVFSGRGTTGYDTLKKEYFSTWIDSLSTGLAQEHGQCDGTGKKYDWTGAMPDPMTGDMFKTRTEQVIADDRMLLTTYSVTDDGEQKMMEIVYTRK